MITLKQYADGHGITYQSARESFNRYAGKGDLKEEIHYQKFGRTVYLTEAGVGMLNIVRKKAPVVNHTAAEAELLAAQVEDLKAQLRDQAAAHGQEIDDLKAAHEADHAQQVAEISRLELENAAQAQEIRAKSEDLINALKVNQEMSQRLLTVMTPTVEAPEKPWWKRIFS